MNVYQNGVLYAPLSGIVDSTIAAGQPGIAGSGYTPGTFAAAVYGTLFVATGGLPVSVSITPTNAVSGAEEQTVIFGSSNTTFVLGGSTDLWNMPWSIPAAANSGAISFDIAATNSLAGAAEIFISEVIVQVTYQNPGNYLYARDLNSWGDCGSYGSNNGTSYAPSYITLGNITLSDLGAPMFKLQHVCGYFDGVGTLDNGGPSIPDVWILPNEISADDVAAKGGIGFVQLPEAIPEPPVGQNRVSKTITARRWPVNMMNSDTASQFIHTLQLKIQFESENAPNTIKAVSFKENQQ